MNKKEYYNINNPLSKLFQLNENKKDTKTLNSLTKKFSSHFIDSISRWLVGSSSNNKSGSSNIDFIKLNFLS